MSDNNHLTDPDKMLDILSQVLQRLDDQDSWAAATAMEQLRVPYPDRKRKSSSTSPNLAAALFHRDRYRCRYCGNRVIPPIVLRAFALAWPDIIGYHTNWRTDLTHPLFNIRSATIDHVKARAHNGGDGVENLVTACWPCNVRKGDLDPELLGMNVREVGPPDWDGLTTLYPVLWNRVEGRAPLKEQKSHQKWLKAFEVALQARDIETHNGERPSTEW